MKLTVDGVDIDLAQANIELTVKTTMPGAMIALVLREDRPPEILLVVTPPPTQSAISPDTNPVAVVWPLHNTTGGAQISGGIGPYQVTYTPTRGSNFAVGVTQVTIDVVSADNQVAQRFFNVDVAATQPPPATLTIVGPTEVNAFSSDGNPVAVTFAALATGGIQPYTFTYFEGATEKFSGNSFAVGVHTIDMEVTDIDSPPNTDTAQMVLTVFDVGSIHDYYNAFVASGFFWKGMSFRPVAGQSISSVHYANQLLQPNQGGYANSNSAALVVAYSPGTDTDPRAQDAAKIVIGTAGNSLTNQVRFPMTTSDGNTYFITWDAWFGDEFASSTGNGLTNYKTFQFDSPRTAGGTATIWTEINNKWDEAPTMAGLLKVRYYAQANTPAGPNVTTTSPLTPQLATFAIATETWTRYWVMFDQQDSDPAWTLFSMWVADETRAPVQIFNQLKITEFQNIRKWWVEYNTSVDPIPPPRPGPPLVSYIRNFGIHLNDTNVASWLVQP